MKNIITCNQCNTENPFFRHICFKCNSYLRERVVNIDLWRVTGLLIESPVKGFSQIIFSEHKNFIVFIIILAALKLMLNSVLVAVALKTDNVLNGFFLKYFLLLAFFSLYIYLYSWILSLIDSKAGLTTRLKDHLAIFTYSFIPHVFGLVFLFIIELVLFGGLLFSYNPSPFLLKETLAYTLLVFEFLVIAWGIFLTFLAAYTQSRSFVYSFFVTLSFNLLLYTGIFLFSNSIIKL